MFQGESETEDGQTNDGANAETVPQIARPRSADRDRPLLLDGFHRIGSLQKMPSRRIGTLGVERTEVQRKWSWGSHDECLCDAEMKKINEIFSVIFFNVF